MQRNKGERMSPKAELTPAEYHALMRLDFYAFIERCFLQLNPSQHFLPNWHIEVIAASWRPVGRVGFAASSSTFLLDISNRSADPSHWSPGFWVITHRDRSCA